MQRTRRIFTGKSPENPLSLHFFQTIRVCYGYVIVNGVCGAKNPHDLVTKAERDASVDLSMTPLLSN